MGHKNHAHGGCHSEENLQDIRDDLVKTARKITPVPLASLSTNSYTPTPAELEKLMEVFGVPQCVSPWKSKASEYGFLFIFFIILVIIIIAYISCYPNNWGYAGGAAIFVIFIILLLFFFWSVSWNRAKVVCQV